MKKLFLCHHSANADLVQALARALRYRGIVPWVDKDGGFTIADHCADEANRAIGEDCFGLLFLATESAFDREFIREVEIPAALTARETNSDYMLFAVPHGIGFDQLRELSGQHFGYDLSNHHTLALDEHGANAAEVASHLLEGWLGRAPAAATAIGVQFSTRQRMPHRNGDALCIDGTGDFGQAPADPGRWADLWSALVEVERVVAARFGRPRIALHGSKHLTSGFMFGKVFGRYPVDIQQTASDVWATDDQEDPSLHFEPDYTPGEDGRLFVAIQAQMKGVARDMAAQLANNGCPSVLSLSPAGPQTLISTGGQCRSLAMQAYQHIEAALRDRPTKQIHICSAAPMSLMLMLGQQFSGTPPVRLYEWDGTRYWPSWAGQA